MQTSAALKILEEVVALRSISGEPAYSTALLETAEYLSSLLASQGFKVQSYTTEKSPPLVIAHYIVDPKAATICVYGHYDVQAVDPIDEWESDPFVVTDRSGKLFGRGVADNKGHIVQNIVAVSQLIAEGTLKNNVVFLLEGKEESGSVHFEALISKTGDMLKDVSLFLITDTGMDSADTPQIYYALRGMVYCEINITSAGRDLHSGIYGNVIANSAQILAELFTSMKNLATGEIHIQDFYKQVRVLDNKEMKLLEKAETTDDALKQETGSDAIRSIRGIQPYLTGKILPSLDIHGILSGFTGEGSKTIIPRTASAKFSCRLVEHQDPEEIAKQIAHHIEKHMPEDVQYSLVFHSMNAPFYTDFSSPIVQKVAASLEQTFGNPIKYNRSGGSIPAAEVLQRMFSKPVVLTGFTLPDDNIHSPNENVDMNLFYKGIEALRNLYSTSIG